jgi:hypothetical protein
MELDDEELELHVRRWKLVRSKPPLSDYAHGTTATMLLENQALPGDLKTQLLFDRKRREATDRRDAQREKTMR